MSSYNHPDRPLPVPFDDSEHAVKQATKETTTEQSGNGVYFADVYEKIAAPFEDTHKDVRGGVQFEYITGEQCITRLNETLGVAGWGFTIKEHGINAEADECWVLGEIAANFGGTIVLRQQFGSQKLKRSRSSGTPLDIGFDLKGAATDALKKCAMQLGVGLYLSKKEQPMGNGNGNVGFGRPVRLAKGRIRRGLPPSPARSCGALRWRRDSAPCKGPGCACGGRSRRAGPEPRPCRRGSASRSAPCRSRRR